MQSTDQSDKRRKIKKIKAIIIATVLVVLIIILSLIIWSNVTVSVSNYNVSANILPVQFDGYKIAHISDLHNTELGKNNGKITEILRQQKPDIIAITGDLVDSSRTDTDKAIDFIKEAVKIAPCYYVTGNHEAWLGNDAYKNFEKQLIDCGVNVLHNQKVLIEKDGAVIQLAGIDDPAFYDKADYVKESIIDNKLSEIQLEDYYTVLLSHRPEVIDVYAKYNIDLVLSGHAHGGQFRLPFIGGIYAPNQGFFPDYDAGSYKKSNTVMIVSRGLGNSVIPVRLNNRPEVVITKLHAER